MSRGAGRRGLNRHGSYSPHVGIESYGVTAVMQRPTRELVALRENALRVARKVSAAIGSPYVGFRVTPWGSETVTFGMPAGLERWSREQAQDTDVWYAVTFDLATFDPTPKSEVHR